MVSFLFFSCLVTCILTNVSFSYVLSHSQLEWNMASLFCQSYCNSNLTSFHNSTEHDAAILYLNKTWSLGYIKGDLVVVDPDAWIGLKDIDGTFTFEWTDGSLFNYGNSLHNYPWRSDQPDGLTDNCVQIDTNNNRFEWTDEPCSETQKFLCQTCNSKLTKYLAIDEETKTYSDAESFCNSRFNTHLASIHSERDFEEAKYIMIYLDITEKLWIGLDDIATNNQYLWKDGTTFDYGINENQHPWVLTEPDNSGDCIALDTSYSNLWIDLSCSTLQKFLCMVPSELCDSNTEWNTVYGSVEMSSSNSICEYIEMLGVPSLSVISNKQWNNNGFPLVIQYIGALVSGPGNYGVIIYNFAETYNYWYIGVEISNDKIFVHKNVQATLHELIENATTALAAGMYYVLGIEMDTSSSFTNIKVYLNDIQYIDYTDSSLIGGVSPTTGSMSGYIGLYNTQSLIRAKSLYLSGSPIFEYAPFNFVTYNPTPSPTTVAPTTTLNPSFNPTNVPSSNPTSNPTNNPSSTPITSNPTYIPSIAPLDPTRFPSLIPTSNPSLVPSLIPSEGPTLFPNNPTSTASSTTSQPSGINHTEQTSNGTKSTAIELETTTESDSKVTDGQFTSTVDNVNTFESDSNQPFYKKELFYILFSLIVCGFCLASGCCGVLYYKKRQQKSAISTLETHSGHVEKADQDIPMGSNQLLMVPISRNTDNIVENAQHNDINTVHIDNDDQQNANGETFVVDGDSDDDIHTPQYPQHSNIHNSNMNGNSFIVDGDYDDGIKNDKNAMKTPQHPQYSPNEQIHHKTVVEGEDQQNGKTLNSPPNEFKDNNVLMENEFIIHGNDAMNQTQGNLDQYDNQQTIIGDSDRFNGNINGDNYLQKQAVNFME